MNLKNSLLLLVITIGSSCFGQENSYQINTGIGGYFSTEDNLPFWLHSNTYASILPGTSYLGEFSGDYKYMLSENSSLSARASIFIHDGALETVQRDEAYIRFQNKFIKATIGASRTDDRFNNLSVVRTNFLRAGNNRPLKGVDIKSPEYIRILKNISLEYGLGHYILDDNETRFVKDVNLHFKKLGIKFNTSKRSYFRATLHHYAMWGGISPDPERGELPDSFTDFINVFLGRAGEGEMRNSIGNHLGLYDLEFVINKLAGDIKIYHQHPFEDGSGSAFKNFPDGIWGIYLDPNKENYSTVFGGFVFEYFQTTSQSGSAGVSGRDNYFNNNIYRNGWTFEGNVIGFPLITISENTRIAGVNAAILLDFKNFNLLLKTTYSQNEGTFFNSFPKEDRVYFYSQIDYSLKDAGNLKLMIGYDLNNRKKDIFGGGLQYSYSFF